MELKRLNEPIYLTLSQRQNHRDRKERLAGAGGWRGKFGGVLELVYILTVVVVTPLCV